MQRAAGRSGNAPGARRRWAEQVRVCSCDLCAGTSPWTRTRTTASGSSPRSGRSGCTWAGRSSRRTTTTRCVLSLVPGRCGAVEVRGQRAMRTQLRVDDCGRVRTCCVAAADGPGGGQHPQPHPRRGLQAGCVGRRAGVHTVCGDEARKGRSSTQAHRACTGPAAPFAPEDLAILACLRSPCPLRALATRGCKLCSPGRMLPARAPVHAVDGAKGYGHVGQRAPFHADQGATDLIALLCLSAAKEGGESKWVSSIAIHNELLRRGRKVRRRAARLRLHGQRPRWRCACRGTG